VAQIEIKGVAKKFGKVEALQSIDLTIAEQEFMVLLGASGCGKTTLLRIIAGLETASGGEVWIGDKRVDHLSPKDRKIAMVFQNYAVFPHLTVYENIAFGLRMAKVQQNEVDRRVNKTAELMHIEQLLQRYSGQLSGGQRQRVAVARALAMEPTVILMYEPLSNLDALLRMEMRAELKSILAESNTTTIYVTHDQVEAMSMADRISIMNNGQIVHASEPVEVYRNPAARFVGSFIGNPPMNFLSATHINGRQWQVGDSVMTGPEPESSTQEVEMAIRPEDIVAGEGQLKALVRVVEPLGPHILASCRVGDQPFRVILGSDENVVSGQELSLTPLIDRVRWFDRKSGQAILL